MTFQVKIHLVSPKKQLFEIILKFCITLSRINSPRASKAEEKFKKVRATNTLQRCNHYNFFSNFKTVIMHKILLERYDQLVFFFNRLLAIFHQDYQARGELGS